MAYCESNYWSNIFEGFSFIAPPFLPPPPKKKSKNDKVVNLVLYKKWNKNFLDATFHK